MISTFLTAYDPSDLPGGSVDPLGFERGFLFLADKLLPRLTNVAREPRYLSLLCLGIHLDRTGDGATPSQILENRRQTLLRTERYWALANVLAKGAESSGGVRGVTYAKSQAEEIGRLGAKRVDAEYPLLSRQAQYGVLGTYSVVADGMRFLDRETLTLSPDLGETIAEAFADETGLTRTLREAMVTGGGDVAVADLTAWGERAHVAGQVGREEARCLRQALHFDPLRSRMAGRLERVPARSLQEDQFDRLRRIHRAMEQAGDDLDLREAIQAILAYEHCYRLALLAFERLLWVCRNHATGQPTEQEVARDAVLARVAEELPGRVKRLEVLLNGAQTAHVATGLSALDDARAFLRLAASAGGRPGYLISAVLSRHTEVQNGKFDRGRRKMPWLEVSNGRITLTLSRVGGLRTEVTTPEEIAAHPYRLPAADNLIRAAAGSAKP